MEDNFEKEWRDAFDDASQEPPKIIWSEISSSLANQKLAKFQTQKTYYQIGVAATLLLAAFFGYNYFNGSSYTGKAGSIAETQNVSKGSKIAFSRPIYQPDFTNESILNGSQDDQIENVPQIVVFATTKESSVFSDLVNIELFEMDIKPSDLALAVDYGEVKDHLYNVPATYLTQRKTKQESEFWAGVDVASGSFDPNFEGGSTNLNNSLSFESNQYSNSSIANNKVLADSPPVREGMSSGQTLGFGVNFGMKLSDRWYIQSGLQYSRSSATNSTNVVVETRQTINPIPASSQFGRVSQVQDILKAEEIVNYSYEDVDMHNQFQFASVPIKAGFRLIDDRFSMGLNAGLLTNFYLGNKLTDPNEQFAEVTIGPGSNSPYRQVNFMGLAGLQLGFEVIRRFDITVEPNYRHSISSLTKENSEFVTNPSGLGLQTGIRYRFQ